ncbi:TPR domain protein [Nitzschia inconspicua]|uniref:TPR domain protein n=1 Tax=Nitzschia inconspicua TaxID=303405 RepID=A0A9K3Q0Y3_9STRA|nr:TPR domain protein [Nitzschia inconspicua]
MASSLDATPDRQLVFSGMEAFRRGKIQESIEKFDASVPPGSKAYLWQRGISYYYNDQFELGSQQFRDDVLRSPFDVEEIVWDIACLLRMDNTRFPPPTMMSLPPGKKDRRPIMSTVYSLFRGEATEHDLADAGHKGGPTEEFYSLFYLGLFNEARGDITKAESYMTAALRSTYAKAVGSRDYMVDCAKVHCQLRHWRA